MKTGWEVIDGVPFYRSANMSRRARGRWRTCLTCGATFPSAVSNKGKYCSPSCRGKAAGRPPNARQDLFETLTRDECWLIGLIWADGCRVSNGVTLVSTDLELAEHANLIARAPIVARKPTQPNRKVAYVVNIGGRPVVARLEALGLTARKSHTATVPDVPHLSDFVRGYFDGDGTVGLHRSPNLRSPDALPRLTSGFVGSHRMMTDLQPILQGGAGIAPKKVHTSKSVWRLVYNHRDSVRLADYMYSVEGAPCLTRKRLIFAEGAAQPFPAATAPLHIRVGELQ